MKTIYLDSEYKCHIENNGTMIEYETDFFDGKCNEFIEGYRIIPTDSSWERADGTIFHGLMVSPWKPFSELSKIQRMYENAELARLRAENAEYEAALSEIEAALGV